MTEDYENLKYDIAINTTRNTLLSCDAETDSDCTLLSGDGALRPCHDTEDCHVICNDTFCALRYIDASSASSLHIECIDDESCAYSFLICPDTTNGSCSIYCGGERACYYLTVSVNTDRYSHVHMECDGTQHSCGQMVVDIDVRSMDYVEIFCIGSDTPCSSMEMALTAEVVNNVTVLCLETSACRQAGFSGVVDQLSFVNVSCVAVGSCDVVLFGMSLDIDDGNGVG